MSQRSSKSSKEIQDLKRPDGHVDSAESDLVGTELTGNPKLGILGWIRFVWRQLTSMRTALLLLLLLAIAAVPGSLVPQRSSDPNGVAQYFRNNPGISPFLDKIQMFDVYTSVWFSSIYILLFISLIGCVVPRTKHHFQALRSKPPLTPANLSRLPAYETRNLSGDGSASSVVDAAEKQLRMSRYRVVRHANTVGDKVVHSVSAERGYLRETGNLVFHGALVGVLAAVGFGGGFGFTGQRVIVEGQTFVNTLAAYDSFNPGRFFTPTELEPYRLTLKNLAVQYETVNRKAIGQALDFNASVTVDSTGGNGEARNIKVNEPLSTHNTEVYLLGNGYAPQITVRNPAGQIVFTDRVPFLPQDTNLTSIGVVKVPDGLSQQLGMVGFFYPTQAQLTSGAFTSEFPDLVLPVLTLNVYVGDLGINNGTPRSVYALDTSTMKQVAGAQSGTKAIALKPGMTADLPDGLGTVSFDRADGKPADTTNYSGSVARFTSLEFHHDPAQGWVLGFSIAAIAGLLLSLFTHRRRVWVKAVSGPDGESVKVVEYGALSRGDDPGLERSLAAIANSHSAGVDSR